MKTQLEISNESLPDLKSFEIVENKLMIYFKFKITKGVQEA